MLLFTLIIFQFFYNNICGIYLKKFMNKNAAVVFARGCSPNTDLRNQQ